MTEKTKQEILLFRRLLQKNAPDLYKTWAARKIAKHKEEEDTKSCTTPSYR